MARPARAITRDRPDISSAIERARARHGQAKNHQELRISIPARPQSSLSIRAEPDKSQARLRQARLGSHQARVSTR